MSKEKKELKFPVKFSGVVYTLVHKPYQGFADYAVATISIKDGVIESMELSDPYMGFEAMHRLELKNEALLEKLRKTYPNPDGKLMHA